MSKKSFTIRLIHKPMKRYRKVLKVKKERILKDDLIKDYPINNLLDGWFFKYWEASNSCLIIEGINSSGRRFHVKGLIIQIFSQKLLN